MFNVEVLVEVLGGNELSESDKKDLENLFKDVPPDTSLEDLKLAMSFINAEAELQVSA